MNIMKGKLESNHLMIISQYFETIDDFKNLQFATSKVKSNMENFQFNPIPLTNQTRKYFNHLETLHIYSSTNETFETETDLKRIIWYEVEWNEEIKKNIENGIVYKKMVLTKNE